MVMSKRHAGKLLIVRRRQTDFERICRLADIGFDILTDHQKLAVADLDRYAGLVICQFDYPLPTPLSAATVQVIYDFTDQGKTAFVEYSLLSLMEGMQPEAAASRRLYASAGGGLEAKLGKRVILDCLNAYFLPAFHHPDPAQAPHLYGEVWAYLGAVRGTDVILDKDLPKDVPALYFRPTGKGRLLIATTAISDFSARLYRPTGRWEQLLACVLQVSLHGSCTRRLNAASRTCSYSGRKHLVCASPAGEFSGAQRKRRYRRALDNLIGWFLESGIMIKPDGRGGVAERFLAEIQHDGTQLLDPALRSDCNVQTALLFILYGKITGNRRMSRTGDNIMRFLVSRGFQFRKKGDPSNGFWFWGRGELGRRMQKAEYPTSNYCDDNCWAASACFALYRLTRNALYLDMAMATAEAFLETQSAKTGLWPARMVGEDLQKRGRGYFRKLKESCFIPHFISKPVATLAYAYQATGDRKFLDGALRAMDALLATFPDIDLVISRTVNLAQLLWALAICYRVTQRPDILGAMKYCGRFLRRHQHSSGGIHEWDNPTAEKLRAGDTGVFHRNGEPVCDLMYSNAFAAINLQVAHGVSGVEMFGETAVKLLDFLCAVQMTGPDAQRRGAWMRAFHTGHWEYYGSNADYKWGPYVIESGWSNAPIGIALAMYLLEDDVFVSA